MVSFSFTPFFGIVAVPLGSLLSDLVFVDADCRLHQRQMLLSFSYVIVEIFLYIVLY